MKDHLHAKYKKRAIYSLSSLNIYFKKGLKELFKKRILKSPWIFENGHFKNVQNRKVKILFGFFIFVTEKKIKVRIFKIFFQVCDDKIFFQKMALFLSPTFY